MPRTTPRPRRVVRAVHRRRAAVGATAAGLAALLLFSGGATAVAGTVKAADPTGPVHTGSTYTVTLITGDVVRVRDLGTDRQAVQIDRPRGARGGVRAETIGKDLYVLPDEAVPFLAAKVVDRRLFDVSALIRQGYDDAHSDGIPLIVSYAPTAAPRGAKTLTPLAPVGTTKTRKLPSINGDAVRASKKRAREVWGDITPAAPSAPAAVRLDDGIAKIWLDGRVQATLAESTAQIGAPSAWAAGLDGHGAKVAVLDTGYDVEHPDLAGRVSLSVSFVPGETVDDQNGHGTHTASTVGGSGAASGGAEKGVAPGADLIIGKVLSNEGFGEDSWVIAGMEWAVAQGADVVSMSLGGSQSSDGTDPMSLAVNELTAASGTLFVIAAGNAGAEASVSAPGAADAALTVGAVDSTDALAYFSSVGPRFGDYGLKPDLSAPGVDILAAKAGGNAIDGYYQALSGTSMATPHVAGAAAILAQAHPDWSAGRLKDALMSTSKQLEYTAYQVGAGRLDVKASLDATLTATGSTYFGFQPWPHSSLPPIAREITFSNSGDTAQTLNLTAPATITGGPYDVDPWADAGTPAPDGMFTLSASSVTVAAHGSATVTLTARPELGAIARRYVGQVVAADSDGAVRTRTQFGVYLEDERHNLRIELKDRAGQPAAGMLELQQFGVWGDPYLVPIDATGVVNIRMLSGTYAAVAFLDVAGSHGTDSQGVALLSDPEVRLDDDRTVILDASKAREATAVVPKKSEDHLLSMNWYRSDGGDSTLDIQYILPATVDSMFVLPTKKVTVGAFEYFSRWRKAYPLLTLTAAGSSIPTMPQAGSSFYDGTSSLGVVFAGDGASSDYAGLQALGKVVLVNRNATVTAAQQAQAAADAGAALLLIVNNGPGKYSAWVGTDLGEDSVVPVATVTLAVGAPLIAPAKQGGLTIKAEGVPNSPYVYDLVDAYPGQVPSDLTYRPRDRDLATVDMKFYGDRSYHSGEFRLEFRPYRRFAFGYPMKVDMPGTRTDYVSASAGTTWAESAITGPGMALVSVSERFAYRPGSHTVRDWFGPVTRPRNGGGFWSSTRYPGYAQFNVQPWADGGAGHAGYLAEGDTLRFDVTQNGTKIVDDSAWASGNAWEVPDGTVVYDLDLEASRDPSVWRLSPSTHTQWHVVSKPVVDADYGDLMPLLQLDYSVDTDLAGRARAGRQTLDLSAGFEAGVVGGGVVRGMKLWISYDDGAHWQSVPVVKAGPGYRAVFVATKGAYVSLKAQAWDSAGNTITQEITRAYQVVTRPHQ